MFIGPRGVNYYVANCNALRNEGLEVFFLTVAMVFFAQDWCDFNTISLNYEKNSKRKTINKEKSCK